MSSTNFEWMERVKGVELEHSAMRLAVELTQWIAARDPSVYGRQLQRSDLDLASANLEGTYIVRLFAEFETCLRSYWIAERNPNPPRRTRDLIDGVAARRRVHHDRIQAVHAVREFRNMLVHEREEETAPISIAQARSHLCRFLSFLPPQW